MQQASFDEIREITASAPAYDSQSAEAAADFLRDRFGEHSPRGSDLAIWLAGVQARPIPRISRPRVVVYAATHGLAADTAEGDSRTMADIVRRFLDGGHEACRLTEEIDGDLKLYDLAVERPALDSRRFSAMEEPDATMALTYGMTAVEEGVDVIVVGAPGAGVTMAAAAIAAVLSSALRPTNVASSSPALEAAARHVTLTEPLEILAALGGPDIAAIFGVILAARFASIPVILDGAGAHAAAVLALALRPDALDHCRSIDPVTGALAVPTASAVFAGAVLQNWPSPSVGIMAVRALSAACSLMR